MAQKPSIPKGTRDFLPGEMSRRNFIFDKLRQAFVLFGFQPIETPAMENLSTLLGKYGEEGDRLLFRILNSGDFLQGAPVQSIPEMGAGQLSKFITEKGLRYDLTVPFARFVVQNQSQLTFPFRRYQIQPVWRADRPQKGRYREFFQCDADVIGTRSLVCEAELISLVDYVFRQLNLRVQIRVNNRKILAGIAEWIGFPDKLTDITVAIDKIEKTSLQQVNEELKIKGLSVESLEKLNPILILAGSNEQKLELLETMLGEVPTGLEGIKELRQTLEYTGTSGLSTEVVVDLSLARGLNYYTGAIFEVKALDAEMGSICGGGRYDDLTGIFGLPGISGVGISFGADRIYDVMLQLNLFPIIQSDNTTLLLVNFGGEEEKSSLGLVSKLREAGIRSEIYPQPDKMKKQFAYADSRNIPLVGIIGEEERLNQLITLKDMKSGAQERIPLSDLISKIGMP